MASPYVPYPTVDSGGGGGTPSSVRATPENFGAQVSKQLIKGGNEAFDIAKKEQGMVNDTEMVNGESILMQKLAELNGEYMSLGGNQARDALPGYTQRAKDIANEVKSTIRAPDAQHGYENLAMRRVSYMTSDWSSHAAGQVRKANMESHLSGISAYQLAAGDPAIAGDDERFGEFVTGPIVYSSESMLDETHAGLMRQEDGSLNFANTPEGNNLKAEFENNLNHNLGVAYINRYNTLADTIGPVQAFEKYENDKDNIPREARVHIESSFKPKVFNAYAGQAVNTIMGETGQEHRKFLLNPTSGSDRSIKTVLDNEGGHVPIDGSSGAPAIYGINEKWHPAAYAEAKSITDTKGAAAGKEYATNFYKKEYWDKYDVGSLPAASQTIVMDGAVNHRPEFAKELVERAKNGASPAELIQMRRDEYQRLATANPEKYGASLEGWNNRLDKFGKQTYATNPNGSPVTVADYYMTHREEIVAKGEKYADRVMPGNLEFKNAVRARLHQQMNDAIADQKGRYNQDNRMLMRAFNGDLTNGKKPMTWDDLNEIPGVKDIVDRSSVNTPEFIRSLDSRFVSRSGGADKDEKEYGKGFPELYKQIRPANPSDPKLTDVSVLYKAFADGELNSAGVKNLEEIMVGRKALDPHDEEIRKQLLSTAKAHITGSNDFMGIKDRKGEALYTKFMIASDQLADKMRSEGKTTAQIYDPDKEMGALMNSFKRPEAEVIADLRGDNLEAVDEKKGDNLRTLNDIRKDLRATKDPTQREKLRQEAIKMGVQIAPTTNITVPLAE